MKRVLVTDGLSPVGVDYLRKEGLEVETVPTLAEAELVARLRGLHGLIVRSATRVTRAVVEADPDLVVIGRAGAGVDNIDVDAATERGVIVMNTPGGNTIAVAEHTIGLLLALARNLPQAHGALKAGRWEKSRYAGVELYNKVLGVVGLGRIGSEVARRALGLSLKVIAYDPYLPREAAERLGVESVELDDLFQRSDFISIHTPLSKDTRNFIDEAQFARMKAGVRIINCARGGVVNEAALTAAIRAGRVGGAALDVFELEPLPAGHLRGMVLNAVNMPSADAETLRELAPYFTLAERLGSFLAQLAEGRMAEARLAYGGGLAEHPTDALTLAFLRGLLNVILEERVTDVNAALVARARGLRVVETSTPDSGGFASLLGATLATDRGEWSVAGALFNHREPRIVRIDGYPLEAVPQGWMLVFANLDVPGVVGRIGTLCGRHHINIAGMQLGRERRGGRAVSILNLDDPVPEAVLDEIRAMPDIVLAKLVKL